MARYGEYYSAFQVKSRTRASFIFIENVRRIVLAAILVGLQRYPIQQALLAVVIQLMVAYTQHSMALIFLQPYKEKWSENGILIFSEILMTICLILFLTSVNEALECEYKQYIGYFECLILLTIIASNMILAFGYMMLEIFRKIKGHAKKSGEVARPLRENNAGNMLVGTRIDLGNLGDGDQL